MENHGAASDDFLALRDSALLAAGSGGAPTSLLDDAISGSIKDARDMIDKKQRRSRGSGKGGRGSKNDKASEKPESEAEDDETGGNDEGEGSDVDEQEKVADGGQGQSKRSRKGGDKGGKDEKWYDAETKNLKAERDHQRAVDGLRQTMEATSASMTQGITEFRACPADAKARSFHYYIEQFNPFCWDNQASKFPGIPELLGPMSFDKRELDCWSHRL